MKGHLIHIGFPKTGSTFLQEWFQRHPQLFYSPCALGGFYNSYDISRLATQTIDNDFLYFVSSDESLTIPTISTGGFITDLGMKDLSFMHAGRLALQKVCDIIKCLYPNGKILFVTRGFKGVTLSLYSQYIKVGGVLVVQEFADLYYSWMLSHEGGNFDSVGTDYSFLANIYEDAFGKENMICLPYELLRDDQNKFLSIIEKQLGLEHFDVQMGRKNESLSPSELYWYPRISWLISRILQRFGKKIYAKVYYRYIGLTHQNKLHKIVALLDKLRPGHRVTEADFKDEMWDYFPEKNAEKFAGKFKDDPNYKPYLSEYLLDKEKVVTR